MRTIAEHRVVLSLAVCAFVGAIGLRTYPFPSDNPILGLVRLERPAVYASFAYTYATLWFTTPFLLTSIAFSLVYIFAARRTPRPRDAKYK